MSYNKINHLLRTCPPDLLGDALEQFDEHFQNMVAEILRQPCLTGEQWDQASLPVKMAGLGVNQTKVIAASAYVGSCTLTKELVAVLLGVDVDTFEPSRVLCSRLMRSSRARFTLCRRSVVLNRTP